MAEQRERWMQQAIDLAVANVATGRGGPFAAIVVQDGELIAFGVNQVTGSNDPTAHAEVTAIRAACQKLGTYVLAGCELYSSCEPCPMCLGAIYWARLDRFFYACNRFDAAAAGFDDAKIYRELALSPDQRSVPGECLLSSSGPLAFEVWAQSDEKQSY